MAKMAMEPCLRSVWTLYCILCKGLAIAPVAGCLGLDTTAMSRRWAMWLEGMISHLPSWVPDEAVAVKKVCMPVGVGWSEKSKGADVGGQ